MMDLYDLEFVDAVDIMVSFQKSERLI